MNDYVQIILAIAAAIGVIGAAAGYVARQLGDAKAKAIEAEGVARAKAITTDADARAKALLTAAETERTEAETTGRFLTAQAKDREQIDSLVADVRAELKQCERDRIADRAEIERLKARVGELERSRDALFLELQEVRRSVDSGGAYPMPKIAKG